MPKDLSNFNSLMVRLKALPSDRAKSYIHKFQFLDGAIKSSEHIGLKVCSIVFQFLDGAIKREAIEIDANNKHTFQFLDGAIKSLRQF